MEQYKEAQIAFAKLLSIMDELREKCPWDKKQTFQSLRHLTLEETYELSDALLEENMEKIKKELGDVMLHLVFYARMASEIQAFNITEVIESLCNKLIDRHPHIYGTTIVSNEEEVKQNWEKLKLKEGNKSVLEGVPASLPSLIKAMRIQEKARGVGFDWENKNQVWEKVLEELNEFKKEEQKPDNTQKSEEEFGDLLFALVNYARFCNINPDTALEKTNRKFIKRFQFMEKAIAEENKKMNEMKLEELDHYWNMAKSSQNSP